MTHSQTLLHYILAFLILLGLGSAPVWAQSQQSAEDEIRTMLEQRNQEIKTILRGSSDYSQEQRDRLKDLINGVVDFRAMAETALGPHWDTLSTDRRSRFVDVFRDVVREQSMSDLDVYNSAVTFDMISVDGDSAFVRTTTTFEGTSTPVEYVLERKGGDWKAEDIIVDDVSTAEGYARSFQSVLRQRGFKSLMAALERKRKQVTNTAES